MTKRRLIDMPGVFPGEFPGQEPVAVPERPLSETENRAAHQVRMELLLETPLFDHLREYGRLYGLTPLPDTGDCLPVGGAGLFRFKVVSRRGYPEGITTLTSAWEPRAIASVFSAARMSDTALYRLRNGKALRLYSDQGIDVVLQMRERAEQEWAARMDARVYGSTRIDESQIISSEVDPDQLITDGTISASELQTDLSVEAADAGEGEVPIDVRLEGTRAVARALAAARRQLGIQPGPEPAASQTATESARQPDTLREQMDAFSRATRSLIASATAASAPLRDILRTAHEHDRVPALTSEPAPEQPGSDDEPMMRGFRAAMRRFSEDPESQREVYLFGAPDTMMSEDELRQALRWAQRQLHRTEYPGRTLTDRRRW